MTHFKNENVASDLTAYKASNREKASTIKSLEETIESLNQTINSYKQQALVVVLLDGDGAIVRRSLSFMCGPCTDLASSISSRTTYYPKVMMEEWRQQVSCESP